MRLLRSGLLFFGLFLGLFWGLFLGLSPSALAQAARDCPRDEQLESIAVQLLLGELEASPEALEEALRKSGSSAIEASALVSRSEGRASAFEEEQRQRRGGKIRCGRAEAEGSIALVISGAGVELTIRDGVLYASLAEEHASATLVARSGEDRLVWENLHRADLARGVPLSDLNLHAPYPELQLLVEGDDGPRPIARIPGPAEARPRLRKGESPRELVMRLRSQKQGQKSRLAPLRESGLLEREARAHAEESCVTGRLAHRSDAGDPEERLRSRGIVARVVGEAMARGANRDAALRAILESPSHRVTIEDPRFTDLGVGVARGDRGVCVVILLASFPRYIPPPKNR